MAYDLTPGHKVRIISYLDPDVVLGGKVYAGSSPENWECCVQRLSQRNDDWTAFYVEAADGGVRFKWAANATRSLSWFGGPRNMPVLLDYDGGPYKDNVCRIDPVKDGNWFALNHSSGAFVLDCYNSDTTAGNRCGSWTWNGGDNQIWRTETIVDDRMYPKT